MAIVQVDFHGEVLCVSDKAVKYISTLFRPLDDEEKQDFIEWAEEQPEGVQVNPVWHPIVQDYLFRTGKGVE